VWCEYVTALSLKVYVKKQSRPDCFPQVFRLGNSVTVLSACVVGSASVVIYVQAALECRLHARFELFFKFMMQPQPRNFFITDSSERPSSKMMTS
jgi:hypothetical protein